MKTFIITAPQKTDLSILSSVGKIMIEGLDTMQVSDGFHTMDELYAHRIALYECLTNLMVTINFLVPKDGTKMPDVWRSRLHSDGGEFPGWFLLGIGKEKGKQITYHLPNKEWDRCEFAETLDKAPEYDGHTPDDVLKRITLL